MSPKPRLMVILLPGTLDWGGKGASIEGNPKTHHVHKPDRTLSTYPFDNNIVRTHRLITNRNQGTLQSTCTESVLLPFLLMGFTVEPLKYIYYSPQNQEREPMRFTVAATRMEGCRRRSPQHEQHRLRAFVPVRRIVFGQRRDHISQLFKLRP